MNGQENAVQEYNRIQLNDWLVKQRPIQTKRVDKLARNGLQKKPGGNSVGEEWDMAKTTDSVTRFIRQ